MVRNVSPKVAAAALVLIVGLVVLAAKSGELVGGVASPTPGVTTGFSGLGASGAPLASPLARPSATAAIIPSGPPRVRALAAREIFGFLHHWKLGKPDTNLPLDQLTTIAVFGVEASASGTLVRQTSGGTATPGWAAWGSTAVAELIRTAHAANVRVVLTVERFAWNAAQARRTVALLSDPARRAALAHEIASELTARGADGVNLDFEPVPFEVRDQFTQFVRELRVALDGARTGLQLTFDTTTAVGGWDLASLTADDAADAALVMGYDYRVAAAATAGSVDPMASTAYGGLLETLDASLTQTSGDHLILALPWYGRAWSTESDQPGATTLDQATYGGSAAVEYADAIDLARLSGRNYDQTEASAWTAYRKKDCATCPETWRQLWYDDVDSLQAKEKLVLIEGLRGLGIWALGDDAGLPELWASVSLTFSEGTDPMPPTGTARVDPAVVTQRHGDLPVVDAIIKLRLQAADDADGFGLAFARVSAGSKLTQDGSLATGITFPAASAVTVDARDARLATLGGYGAQRIFVQWRDIAGNWSTPVAVPFWVSAAASTSGPPLP